MISWDSLLDAVGSARWIQAEDATIDLVRTGRFRDPHARVKTAIVVAQARILGQLDARGAYAALLPALSDPALRELEPSWLARANVVSTFVLGAPDGRYVEPARLEASLRHATGLTRHAVDPDLRALGAVATLGGGVVTPAASRVASHGLEVEEDLGAATEPVTRCLVLETRVVRAGSDGPAAAEVLEEAFALAQSIGFDAAVARLSLIAASAGPASRRGDALEMARAAIRRGGIAAPWLLGRLAELESELG